MIIDEVVMALKQEILNTTLCTSTLCSVFTEGAELDQEIGEAIRSSPKFCLLLLTSTSPLRFIGVAHDNCTIPPVQIVSLSVSIIHPIIYSDSSKTPQEVLAEILNIHNNAFTLPSGQTAMVKLTESPIEWVAEEPYYIYNVEIDVRCS